MPEGHPDLAVKYCIIYTVTPVCGVKGDGCDRVEKWDLEIFYEESNGERVKLSEAKGRDVINFFYCMEQATIKISERYKQETQ